MRVNFFLIIKRTGQIGPDGEELVVIFDSALSREKADRIIAKNPGTEAMKMMADNHLEGSSS